MTRLAPQPVGQKHPVCRDRQWLDSAKDRPCDICGSIDGVVFAHDRRGMMGGMGFKPDDWCGGFFCYEHHQEQGANPLTTLAWDKLTRTLINMPDHDVLRDASRAFVRVLMEARHKAWRAEQ